MGRFNLLDEAWISVVIDDKGRSKEVSLKELFVNAHLYRDLAGDTKTQDFAVLRVLLAVIHTVFSRFDADGKEYEYFKLDERLKQIEKIDEDDVEDYIEDLYRTWCSLWKNKKFPDIIQEYLEKWRNRFFLFDKAYPFFQVRKTDIGQDKINKSTASSVSGKNINRLISESGNKVALFSPKYASDFNKEKLKEAEIARWLITFQGYTGLSDKVIFGKEKYKSSKGWLFDIGGIYIKGNNLFETLVLNCILVYKENRNLENIQKPCWEYAPDSVIKSYFYKNSVDNISSLYTAWSRAVYIDTDIDQCSSFSFSIVKLPEIDHQNKFLEPMTMWKYNESGDNKDAFTPKKHLLYKSLWRSFGLLTRSNSVVNQRKPGIMEWVDKINKIVGERNIIFCAISMQDDGNATSWVPTDEISDDLSINDYVLTDFDSKGWVIRINETIEKTELVVGTIYRKYINDVKEIRNISSNIFVSSLIEDLYFKIDGFFRTWLANIRPEDDKDKKIHDWESVLKHLVMTEARNVLNNGSYRDYVGIIKEGRINNIVTAYNRFLYFLNKELQKEEGYDAYQ